MSVYANTTTKIRSQSVASSLAGSPVGRYAVQLRDNRTKSAIAKKQDEAASGTNASKLKTSNVELPYQVKTGINTNYLQNTSGIYQLKEIIPVSSQIVLPLGNHSLYGDPFYNKSYFGSTPPIQLHQNRLITDPFFNEARRTIPYFSGWILEIIDIFSRGNLYDGFALLLSITGDTGLLEKIEEVVRYLQHHPEVAALLGVSLSPFLVSTFGIPLWAANIILTVLSRGSLADAIGNLAFSMLMISPYATLLATPIVEGLKRRLGRSLINRGLVFAYSLGGYLSSAVSGLSRLFHGYSLTSGIVGNGGEGMEIPSSAFGGLYSSVLSYMTPIERLHVIPARRGGRIHDENAAYGAAATNSLMIPNETAGHPATAIQGPSGLLEGMGMRSGLFMGRGIRPHEGYFEHGLARLGIA